MILVSGDNADLIAMVLSEAGIDDNVVDISDGLAEVMKNILDEIFDIKRGMNRMWSGIQELGDKLDAPKYEDDIPF
jgi:hypothetical protein